MDKEYDGKGKELREDFYRGIKDTGIIIYLSRKDKGWSMESPKFVGRYDFPAAFARDFERVEDKGELMKEFQDIVNFLREH